MLDSLKLWFFNLFVGDKLGGSVRHAISAASGVFATLGIQQALISTWEEAASKLVMALIAALAAKYLSSKNKTV